MTLSGGRNDTVMDNTFSNNGAWGTLFIPYPDSGKPSLDQKCANYGGFQIKRPRMCLRGHERQAGGQHLRPRRLLRESDERRLRPDRPPRRPALAIAMPPTRATGGAPPYLEVLQPTCGVPSKTTTLDGALVTQVECDSGLASCPAGDAVSRRIGCATRAVAAWPADDGQPVCRGAVERVVHLRLGEEPRCGTVGRSVRSTIGDGVAYRRASL